MVAFTREFGNPMRALARFAARTACAAIVLLTAVPGCIQVIATAPDPAEIEATTDETAQGTLFGGQTLLAAAGAEADHIYALWVTLASITGELEASGEVLSTVSGDALEESVECPVLISSGGTANQEPNCVFLASADGELSIEFTCPPVYVGESASPFLQTVRSLIQGPTQVTYELLLADLGFDDNGTSAEEAVTLPVGPEGEQVGTIVARDDGDYFVLSVTADLTYEIAVESTGAVSVISGIRDRFGQINFGVPTPGGLAISVSASPGISGTAQFAALATEEVLLRLTAEETAEATDVLSARAVQYAISVVEVVPEGG